LFALKRSEEKEGGGKDSQPFRMGGEKEEKALSPKNPTLPKKKVGGRKRRPPNSPFSEKGEKNRKTLARSKDSRPEGREKVGDLSCGCRKEKKRKKGKRRSPVRFFLSSFN